MALSTKDFTAERIRKVEKVKLNKKCRVKEHNSDKAVPKKAGDIVNVSGLSKMELLFRPIDENTKLGELVAKK